MNSPVWEELQKLKVGTVVKLRYVDRYDHHTFETVFLTKIESFGDGVINVRDLLIIDTNNSAEFIQSYSINRWCTDDFTIEETFSSEQEAIDRYPELFI